MSEPHPEHPPSAAETAAEAKPPPEPAETPAAAAEAAPPPSPAPAPETKTWQYVSLALAGSVVAIVVLIGTAPFWAGDLPWGARPSRPDTALADRISRLETAQQPSDAARQRLEQRIGALEGKPGVAPAELADLRQQIGRVAAAAPDLTARIEASDRAAQAQAAAAGEMAKRLDALDKTVRAQAAVDTTDMGLVLVLLQIRGAIETGRPFATEYGALVSLARTRPEITAGAAALADPAKTGVATNAVLVRRLRELAGSIAAAKGAPADRGWEDEALAKLKGLVTIRRIDGAAPGGADAAVNAAELALAAGDLKGAAETLDKLTGAAAEVARPWLAMAHQRLAVETALRGIETLLVARFGPPASPR